MSGMFRHSVFFIALTAAISGLLFGYDAGIISGAMLFIKKSFLVTSEQIGLIVSAVPLGAMLIACFTGKISDWIGRKKLLFTTAVLFIIGSLICAFSYSPDSLIIGRLFLGFAVGMSSSLAPVYIAEISEKNRRGKLVTLFLISVNFGLFISYLVNLILSYQGAWRIMLGLGVVPALLLMMFVFLLPESPRWLVLKGRIAEAKKILEKIHTIDQAKFELKEIEQIIQQEHRVLHSIFHSGFTKVLILGALVGIFTQAVGINAVIYYAPIIFQKTGFSAATTSICKRSGTF